MNLIERIKSERRVNTPLLALQSQDQPACQQAIAAALTAGEKPALVFAWDAIRGLRGADERAVAWVREFMGGKPDGPAVLASKTGNPNAALDFAQNLPERALLFMTNADLFWSDPVTQSAVLNLRDPFKLNKRTLVGTGAEFSLPTSLQTSVVLIDDPLPTDDEVQAILDRLYQGAKVPFPALDDEQKREAIQSVRGLSAFMAEQTFASSLEKDKGLNLPVCWEKKRAAFNQIDGLTLESDEGPTFDDIRGLEQIRKRQAAHFSGKNASAVIVRIEEIEKALAGATGDSSGTSQAALGYILDFMQEKRCTGFVALGPGGSGKSLVSKALGRTFHRPVVAFDVKGTEDKLVGESGRKIRTALKAIHALAGGRPILFVATCNGVEKLPAELKRRFKQGIWFFDLPTEGEREAIWKLYLGKLGVKGNAKALAKRFYNWTGAEIFNATEQAADESISIEDAAAYVVPVAEADPERLRQLRNLADGRFLSASVPGPYSIPKAEEVKVDGSRKIDFDEEA